MRAVVLVERERTGSFAGADVTAIEALDDPVEGAEGARFGQRIFSSLRLTRRPDRRGHTWNLPWRRRGDVACLQPSRGLRFTHHQDGSARSTSRDPTGMGRNDPAPPTDRGPGVLGLDAQRASGVVFDGAAHGTCRRGRAGGPLPRKSCTAFAAAAAANSTKRTWCTAFSLEARHGRHAARAAGWSCPSRRRESWRRREATTRRLLKILEVVGRSANKPLARGSRDRSEGRRRARHVNPGLQESDPRLPPPRGGTQGDRS